MDGWPEQQLADAEQDSGKRKDQKEDANVHLLAL